MARAKLQLKSPGAPRLTQASTAKQQTDETPKATRPDRAGLRMIGGHFPQATWAALRKLAVDENRTTQELFGEALDDLLAKYGQIP